MLLLDTSYAAPALAKAASKVVVGLKFEKEHGDESAVILQRKQAKSDSNISQKAYLFVCSVHSASPFDTRISRWNRFLKMEPILSK